MDRATLNNSPREFTLGGRTFQVANLTEAEKGRIQAWLKAHHPSPLGALDDAMLARFGPAHRRAIIEAAVVQEKSWPPWVGSPPWMEAMDQAEGWGKFLHVALSRLNEVTEEECSELYRASSLVEAGPLIYHALGFETTDPKSPGATGTATEAGNPTPAN